MTNCAHPRWALPPRRPVHPTDTSWLHTAAAVRDMFCEPDSDGRWQPTWAGLSDDADVIGALGTADWAAVAAAARRDVRVADAWRAACWDALEQHLATRR